MGLNYTSEKYSLHVIYAALCNKIFLDYEMEIYDVQQNDFVILIGEIINALISNYYF